MKSLTYNIQTYNSVKEVLFFNDNQSKNFGFSYINKGNFASFPFEELPPTSLPKSHCFHT